MRAKRLHLTAPFTLKLIQGRPNRKVYRAPTRRLLVVSIASPPGLKLSSFPLTTPLWTCTPCMVRRMASALLDRHHGLLLDDMAGVGDWTPFFRQSSLSAPWIFDGKGYDELAGCGDRPDRDRSVCGPAIHPVLESRGPLRRMGMEPWRSDTNRWVSELDRFKWGQVPRLSSNR